MAVELHKVVYGDGSERVKQLHREDAERLKDQKNIESVTKLRSDSQDKQRSSQRAKSAAKSDDDE